MPLLQSSLPYCLVWSSAAYVRPTPASLCKGRACLLALGRRRPSILQLGESLSEEVLLDSRRWRSLARIPFSEPIGYWSRTMCAMSELANSRRQKRAASITQFVCNATIGSIRDARGAGAHPAANAAKSTSATIPGQVIISAGLGYTDAGIALICVCHIQSGDAESSGLVAAICLAGAWRPPLQPA